MGIDRPIDITADQRKNVLALLERYLPNTTTWVYGSRANWTSRPQSDLDMVVFATPEQNDRVAELREAFEESDLPFRVDLFVWDTVPEEFRKRIKAEHVVLVERKLYTPGGWNEVTLGDCVLMNESTYSPKESWPFINYLDTGNITDNRITKIQHLIPSTDKVPSRARRKVRDGDIVYSTVRPNQRHFGLLRETPKNCLVSTGFAVIRGKENIADTEFIFWFLAQSHIVEHLHTIAEHSTSAYPSIRPSDIKQLKLRLPPLPEQRAIAHILGTLDDKIELNRRMNETLEVMARALFKSWFVDFDPVRAKIEGRWRPGESLPGLPAHLYDLFPDRLVESELGEVPEGWEVKALDEIADYLNGLACQKYPPVEGQKSLPVIKIRELRQGITDNSDRATMDVPPKYIVKDGDILFSWSGSLLVTIWCGGHGVLNQHVFKITSAMYPNWFYYQATKHHLEKFQQIASDKATTMGHIKRHHLTDAKIVIPDKDMMQKCGELLGTIICRRINILKNIQVLALTRDTLLSELVSGKVRVQEVKRFLFGGES